MIEQSRPDRDFRFLRFSPIILGLILFFGYTTTARGQEIKEDNQQVRPLQFITSESVLSKAQIGVGIAVELYPATAGIKKMADLTKIVLDEAVTAATFRNSVIESHLLIVSAEATKLEEIRQRRAI